MKKRNNFFGNLFKKKKKKKAISSIIVVVILIALVLLALGILWAVITNIISEKSEGITLETLTVDAEIKGARIDQPANNISVLVRRKPGHGNLIGFKFVFNDGINKEIHPFYMTQPMQELEERFFTFHLKINVSEVITVTLSPLIQVGGKETLGNLIEIYNLKEGKSIEPPTGGEFCGNNMKETGEACDGTDLGGQICEDLGFTGGTLACYYSGHPQECTYDTTSCTSGSVINLATRTCSQVWGVDCGEVCGIEIDNTYDSCSNCENADERIEEVWINATSVEAFTPISVICQYYTSETTDDEIYVYYRNSTLSSWQEKCSESSSGIGSTIRNFTCDFEADNVLGQHQVRCIIDYEGQSDECGGGGSNFYDNDDANFMVI